VYTGEEAAALDEEERNRHARSTLLRYKMQCYIFSKMESFHYYAKLEKKYNKYKGYVHVFIMCYCYFILLGTVYSQ
jgi:hypothetical protein